MTDTSIDRKKIPLKTKLFFFTGALEEAMIGAAGVATMIFYNQVLGVDPALPLYWIIVGCGLLFMGKYQLNERRHGEIMADLEVRRAGGTVGHSSAG